MLLNVMCYFSKDTVYCYFCLLKCLLYVFLICSVKKEHSVHINAGIDC